NRRRDADTARGHLHRSLAARDLLLELVPPAARESFRSHPRFHALAEAELRWRNAPRTPHALESTQRSAAFEGMLGRSTVMLRVFETIEKASRTDVPML